LPLTDQRIFVALSARDSELHFVNSHRSIEGNLPMLDVDFESEFIAVQLRLSIDAS
jgi:hypothetical protein